MGLLYRYMSVLYGSMLEYVVRHMLLGFYVGNDEFDQNLAAWLAGGVVASCAGLLVNCFRSTCLDIYPFSSNNATEPGEVVWRIFPIVLFVMHSVG